MSSSKRIAIFAATAWEVQAVLAAFSGMRRQTINDAEVFSSHDGASEYWVARTGVGMEKARRRASWLLQQRPYHLVVSTGFACSLINSRIGSLLIGREVMPSGTRGPEPSVVSSVPGAERDALLAYAGTVAPKDHIGTFVSVDRVIGRAVEKQLYARRTGAIGLDMESAALAMEAEKAQVPFVIVRTVSDLLDEDLPLDFNLFLRPTDWFKGIASMIGAPSSLLGLGRLRRQSQAAAKGLTTFFQHYINAMATVSPKGTSGA